VADAAVVAEEAVPALVEEAVAAALELVVGAEALELAGAEAAPVSAVAAATPVAGSVRAAAGIVLCLGQVGADRCLHSVAPRHAHRLRQAAVAPAFRSAVAIVRTSLPEM
jgi:hypothetical protein